MRDNNYREALLAYIDVLGFKKLIEKSVADARLFSEILALLRRLKDQTGSEGWSPIYEKGKPPTSVFRAFNFSDLTVRATYAHKAIHYFSLCQWEFLYLCRVQINLVCRTDFLIRGAISAGLISMEPNNKVDDDILFGPALIRAYELEKERPGPPRIVIDSSVLKKAEQYRDSYYEGEFPWPVSIYGDNVTSDHGKSFIDYLFSAAVQPLYSINEKPVGLLGTLQAHKDAVERRIKNLKDADAGVVEKLRWLVSYHNDTVSRLQAFFSPDRDPFDTLSPEPMDIPDSLRIAPAIIGTTPSPCT